MSDSGGIQARVGNLQKIVAERLPDGYQQALRLTVEEAARQGMNIYIVGGSVRDLLLGNANLDVDIAVEGDAIALATAVARRLAAENGGGVAAANARGKVPNLKSKHPKFGTATLQQENPLVQLDFATTRAETYVRAAALPRVQPVGEIATDLRRRDFTINAMAVRLPNYVLIDPYGGLADLEAKRVRALHAGSFTDDPTRIFRAVRYEQRLYFAIEGGTLGQIKQAVADGLIDLLTPDRVRHELVKIMREERAPAMLWRLGDLGVLAAIDPALRWDEQLRRQADAVALAEAPEDGVTLYLLLLTYRLSEVEQQRVTARLNLDVQSAALIAKMRELRGELASLTKAARRSEIYALLQKFPDVVLLATTYVLAAYGQGGITAFAAVIEKIDLYRRELVGIKPHLDGRFLTKLGLTPGPRYKEILAELQRAKLDGEVVTRKDEEALLRRLVSTIDPSPDAGKGS